MEPELKVFLLVTATMTCAYTIIYPRLASNSLARMVQIDLALSALLLLATGSVYFGTQTAFSLILFTVPWWVFTLVAAAVVETPLLIWSCKRRGMDIWPPQD